MVNDFKLMHFWLTFWTFWLVQTKVQERLCAFLKNLASVAVCPMSWVRVKWWQSDFLRILWIPKNDDSRLPIDHDNVCFRAPLFIWFYPSLWLLGFEKYARDTAHRMHSKSQTIVRKPVINHFIEPFWSFFRHELHPSPRSNDRVSSLGENGTKISF